MLKLGLCIEELMQGMRGMTLTLGGASPALDE